MNGVTQRGLWLNILFAFS